MARKVRSMSRTSGITTELTGDGNVESPQRSHRVSCIFRVKNVTFSTVLRVPEPLFGPRNHPWSKVECHDPSEAVDQVRQQRPGPAAEVGDGFRARVGNGENLDEQRDSRPPGETGQGTGHHTGPQRGSIGGLGDRCQARRKSPVVRGQFGFAI